MINKDNGLGNLCVLVVDDDKSTRNLMKALLESFGVGRIVIVNNGKAALEAVQTTVIDMVICDWRMPLMSGIELTKAIRALPASSRSNFLNILLLTGNSTEENVIEARDAGITEYLIKPFTAQALCDKIIEIIKNPREFIISPNYKGPSRRRKNLPPPDGIEKRKDNLKQKNK